MNASAPLATDSGFVHRFGWDEWGPCIPDGDGIRTFDIGYVPNGWSKGEDLILRPALPDRYGIISRRKPAEATLKEVGALVFESRQEPRVRAWLDWWKQ